MKRDRFARGFTVIGLSAVTAIVVVQASILGPAVMRGSEKSRQNVCLSRMRHVGRAYMMYARDYGTLVPAWAPGRPPASPPHPLVHNGTRIQWYEPGCWTWNELLCPYVVGSRKWKVFECPSAVYISEPIDGHMPTSFRAVFWSADPNEMGTPPMSNLGGYGPYSTPVSAIARPNESIVLTDTPFAKDRDTLNALYAERATHSGAIGLKSYQEILNTCDAMKKELNTRVSDYPQGDFVAARKFIDSLAYDARHQT